MSGQVSTAADGLSPGHIAAITCLMSARDLAWRACYELLAGKVPSRDWSFMNYGFASTDDRPAGVQLQAIDEPDRLSIQLYDHALADTDLTGLDVLEVGSGRGGGASYVSRCLGPRSVTGVDFSGQAVRLSSRDRGGPGVRFVRGDATDLPFPDGSFDVVINIESSHCYGSMADFLTEVSRVLRPGGRLHWADFRDVDELPRLREHWRAAPLSLESEDDVTANVVAALCEDDARKRAMIDTWIPRLLHRPVHRFAGTRGSATFARFESGERRYLSARLRTG